MTVEEMTDTLDRLGVRYFNINGYEIQAHCPAHVERTGHEDHNPSFFINADSGAFICFSCQWKGNLYTLISYVEQIDFAQAKDWMNSPGHMLARFERAIAPKPKPVLEELTHVTESMLSAFTMPPAEALLSRGLTVRGATHHGLLWDARRDNWIIPIRNPKDNKLMGWQEKGYNHRYFNNKPSKVKKSLALFGYGEYTGGDMIVVESPLDVVRLTSLGKTGGVATYGATVSEAQFSLIRDADRVIFAMDNDPAGINASRHLLSLCNLLGKEAWFFNYGAMEIKDIGGMSFNEIEYGLAEAVHMVRGIK